MDMQGYFTGRGLELSAKLAAGAKLRITRVVAGSGRTEALADAATLCQPRQELAVNTSTRRENTAIIPATLTAAQAETAYLLTELGVYAHDPEKGEILYKLYRLSEPVEITPDSRLVLRFYLEETISQDLGITVDCSPAGLLTEADIESLRVAVESPGVSTRIVALSASDLPEYLACLPRLVTENLVLQISGTLEEPIDLFGFYGSGALQMLPADSGARWTVKNTVSVRYTKIPIDLYGADFLPFDGMEDADAFFSVQEAPIVHLNNDSFTGNGTGTAISVAFNSGLICEDTGITGFEKAILCTRNSAVSVIAEPTVVFERNAYGAYLRKGGIVMLSDAVPDLLGGVTHVKDGGMVVKANGTLL